MKTIFTFLSALFFLGNSAFSQGMPQTNAPARDVTEAQFTANPSSFAGQLIRIKNVSVILQDAPGMQQGKPCYPTNTQNRIIKVEFTNPNYKGCFEIPLTLCNSIPKNLECIGNITFKVSTLNAPNLITDCKIQP